MDYSKYYLKNYRSDGEGLESLNYNNAYYRYYRSEKQLRYEPAVVYTQPAPQASEEDKAADIEYYPADLMPERERVAGKRGGFKRKLWLIALCFSLVALSCLSTFLATDIITDGAVIGTMKEAFVANKSGVFVSYLRGCVDYESAKLQSEQMRKEGMGGYIAVSGGEYLVYADISARDNVVTACGEAELSDERLSLKEINFDALPQELAPLARDHGEYTQIFLGYMFEIIEKVTSGEWSTQSASQQIADLSEEFSAMLADFLQETGGYTDSAVLKLTGDMRAEEAFLRTLSGEKYSSSAALLADARYYALLALFNANASRA